jgi:hypothetical protein
VSIGHHRIQGVHIPALRHNAVTARPAHKGTGTRDFLLCRRQAAPLRQDHPAGAESAHLIHPEQKRQQPLLAVTASGLRLVFTLTVPD